MIKKYLLGYDIGSSSIKASVIDAETGELVRTGVSPEVELKIEAPHPGWAEQHPDTWWKNLVIATKQIFHAIPKNSYTISAIGISYQMHGLVLVDRDLSVLRPGIIWCDSRAVEIGNKALRDLGSEYCLGRCLNSPGNFTASKLKWVKDNEPQLYKNIYKIMLPGDYIAMKLTGRVCTTVSGLSEGVFWDFKNKNIADDLIDYYGIERNYLPEISSTFGSQGELSDKAADELGLSKGIPVTYRSGDQPNNALSLNVLNPGEIAATAGTSGVIYGVSDKIIYDIESRVNTFAHVNYSNQQPNVGVLLCINGTGIQYSWLKQNIFDNSYKYNILNDDAAKIKIGSDGLFCYPFGNGAERIFKNKNVGAHFSEINFNVHTRSHLVRASQEGIAFAFRYGMDIMKSIGMKFNVVRAGNSNLFLSKLFREAFVNTCKVNLQIYNTDGSQGAARGAGIGAGIYNSFNDAFAGLKVIEEESYNESLSGHYNETYAKWKSKLEVLVND